MFVKTIFPHLKKKSCFKIKIWFILLVLSLLARLLPLPPNFSPMASLFLFSGAFFSSRWQAITLPLLFLILTDFLLIGWHSTFLFVYGTFVLIGFLSFNYVNHQKPHKTNVLGMSLLHSFLFFILTNLGVWLVTPMYYKNAYGLVECYFAAIPFFHNTVLGNIFFSFLYLYIIQALPSFQKALPSAVK